MTTFITVLVALAMLATVGILFAGLLGLVRGSPDAMRSNRLMRYRVLMQGAAVLLFVLLLSLLKS